MKSVLKVLAAIVLVLVLLGAGGFVWASSKATSNLEATVELAGADFPIPFPVDAAEIEASGLTPEEAEALAVERAMERGTHLVQARYGCIDCHAADFSGGVMIDAAPMGRIFGPNLTGGAGSRIDAFTPSDWDRIVRHGVLPDDRRAVMPAQDFQRMTDQELSDIITYIRHQPAVDNETPPVTLGPIGKVLSATGQLGFAYDVLDHSHPHGQTPPEAAVSVEFGEHLAAVCVGCHGPSLSGGPIMGGDPSWAPAANLTPHADGLADWSYEQFVAALRDMVRPDGTELLMPMTLIQQAARNMTDTEVEAMWTYLRTLPPVETGAR